MIVYLLFSNNGFMKYSKLLKMRDDYQEEIQLLDGKNDLLEEEAELMKKDKDYMEFIIRKELNMKKPEEELYIIRKNANETKTDSNRTNKNN